MRTQFQEELDEAFTVLSAHKLKWAGLEIAEKIAILKEIQGRLVDNLYSWGRAGAELRGLLNDDFVVGDSTLVTPVVLSTYIGALINTLTAATSGTFNLPPLETRTTPAGQLVVKVHPCTQREKNNPQTGSLVAEMYIQPDKPASQGAILFKKDSKGQVAALLGAGNLGFLGVKDVLYSLFEVNQVVIFKPHPLQAAWHKFADYVLEPLSRRGYYRSVYTESVDETQAMLYHKGVDHVHMTGGTPTHDAIVWGASPEEQATRRAANNPVLKVPITSELGCVTPWIVTSGVWTDQQLDGQALDVVQALTYNNSCCCNAIKILILPQAWPQADEFLTKIKQCLRGMPLMPAFYPNVRQRYDDWKKQATRGALEIIAPLAAPSSKAFASEAMPYLIQELPFPESGTELSESQRYAFKEEPFAPVLTVVRVPAADDCSFMQKSTHFCNHILWGTLSCTVLLHPDMERDYPVAAQQMLDELQYGSVVVNTWSAAGYSVPHSTWGAYNGGQTTHDIGSGLGMINNTQFIDFPQKTVIKGPLTGAAVSKPINKMGLPTWALKPLAGFLLGGLTGVVRALWSK